MNRNPLKDPIFWIMFLATLAGLFYMDHLVNVALGATP